MIDYLIAGLGALLMVVPAEFLSRKKLQNVSLHDVMLRSRFRYAWLHLVNVADLMRAWGGAYVLASVTGRILPAWPVEIVKVVMLGVCACAGLTAKQLLHSKGEDDLLAPCAYLIGLTFALMPALLAFLALAIGAVVGMGLSSLAIGFAVAGIATGGLGIMLKIAPLQIACAGLLLLSPALCAVMLQRRLVLAVRPSHGTRNAPLREVPVSRRG